MQTRFLNKSLIAMASLAAMGVASAQSVPAPTTVPAPAQAGVAPAAQTTGVSISGVLDVGYKNTSNSDGTKNKHEFINNNSTTSLIYFKGFKELSNGMRASFLLEVDPNPAQGSTLNGGPSGNAYNGTPFNGEQYLALAGSFGDLKLGSPNSAGLVAGTTAQPFGTQMGGGYSGAFGRLGTASLSGVNQFDGNGAGRLIRHEKTGMYTTPVFDGFKATLEVALGNSNSPTVTNDTNAGTTVSLQYNKAPLNAIYVHSTERAGTYGAAGATSALGVAPGVALPAGTSVSWNMLAANYKFGDFTLMGGVTKTSQTSTPAKENSNSWNIAGKYQVAKDIELVGNYLVRNSKLANTSNAKVIGAGVNYFIDPTTNLYFRFENLRFDASGTVSSSRQNSEAVGVRYQF